jgi:hypothetical protein
MSSTLTAAEAVRTERAGIDGLMILPPATLVVETPDHVDVLVGFAGVNMLESFDRGAVGVVPGSSMFDVYLQIYDRYHDGDREGILAFHNRPVPFLNQSSRRPRCSSTTRRQSSCDAASSTAPRVGRRPSVWTTCTMKPLRVPYRRLQAYTTDLELE